jgi:alpha-tubulin suppressor-like RCC1 family protein
VSTTTTQLCVFYGSTDSGCQSGQSGQDEETEHSWQELEQTYPAPLMTLSTTRITHAACGARHTALLTDKAHPPSHRTRAAADTLAQGEMLTFGGNAKGQLGTGTTINHNVPTPVSALMDRRIVQIGCGHDFTAALTAEGEVCSTS